MWVAFVLVALLALTLVVHYFKRAMAPPPGGQWRERFADVAATPKHKLVYLYMKSCPWCERFDPQWQEFTTTYAAPLKAAGVEVAKLGSHERAAAKYKEWVQGYPTVLLVRLPAEDSASVFEGQRTPAGLLEFLADNGVQVRENFAERLAGLGSETAASTGGTVGGSKMSDDEIAQSQNAGAPISTNNVANGVKGK